jgi:D-amino-acid dehydrogenase
VLTEMKRRSLAILRDLCATEDLATTFAVSGMVVAFRTRQGFQTARRSVPAAVAGGVATRVLTPGELRDLEPGVSFDIAGALYQENGGYLHAPGFLVGLAGALRGMGVDIREHAAVVGFEVWRDRVVRIRTTSGDFEPGEAVLAAGTWSAWCARQLGVPVPLQPVKGYAITLPRSRGAPRAPVLLSEDSVAVRPLGERLRLAGGVELSADRTVSRRRVAAILGAVHAYLPGLDLAGAHEVWTGLRPCTPDSLPYLGRTARYANLTLACGHGHVGMGLAPIGGKLVAQLVVGDRPDMDVRPFETDRFTRGRG